MSLCPICKNEDDIRTPHHVCHKCIKKLLNGELITIEAGNRSDDDEIREHVEKLTAGQPGTRHHNAVVALRKRFLR